MDHGEADQRGDVTRLLGASRKGDPEALDRLMPLVYEDLRRLAARQLRREHAARTLHATALVHEAYLKLSGPGGLQAGDRGHFLAIAARAMRQVLVDEARRRKSARRGGGWARTTLAAGSLAVDFDPDQILALDEALGSLDARQRQIVELRFFAGMEEREVAEVLNVSDRTVRREWTKARAHLYRRLYLQPDAGGDASGEARGETDTAGSREP